MFSFRISGHGVESEDKSNDINKPFVSHVQYHSPRSRLVVSCICASECPLRVNLYRGPAYGGVLKRSSYGYQLRVISGVDIG
jgi:hypothetical protein